MNTSRLFPAALSLALLALGSSLSAGTTEKLRVFVPVLPYEYLFERIGGDWIDVKAIVQEGGDCHNYSPSPRQITDISRANLLFSSGLSFESNFFVAVGDGITSPKDIDLLQGLDLLEGSCAECEAAHAAGKEAEAHKHDHEELKDAHVWLSAQVLLHQSKWIAELLKQHLPPAAAESIDTNYTTLKTELETLDGEIRKLLESKKGEAFYVYHGAFAYFARDYGMVQKAIEMGNRRPSPKQIAEIAKQAKEEGVKAIFVQPQFDQSSAISLAEAIGGKVQTLDPLEKDVIANLRTIAQTIAAAN